MAPSMALLPVVEFDFSLIGLLSKLYQRRDYKEERREECAWRRRDQLHDLEKVLQYRVIDKISMKRFTVYRCSGDDEFESFVDRCVFYAILSGVKELELSSMCPYDLPPMALSAELIQILELAVCNLESSRSNVKLPCLKTLRLVRVYADDDMINDLIANCPLIEDLIFIFCQYRSIKISSPNLESLIIDNCLELVEVKIEAPKLNLFRYQGKIIPLDFNALDLTECTLCYWPQHQNINTRLKVKLFELLAKFHNMSKVLRFYSNAKTVTAPLKFRRTRPCPLYGVKHLNFNLCLEHENSSTLEVLHSLLWIAPHAETISIRCDLSVRSFKFLYKKQLTNDGQTHRCCKTLPLSCWQQCIQNVMIELGTTKEYDSNEVIVGKRYSFEGKDIYEKIRNLRNLDFTNNVVIVPNN